ncbi:MAG: c-type cytochrome [Chloroflexi bacterium]|nr:c-type cytochrome [Chloroflexota bacterium]
MENNQKQPFMEFPSVESRVIAGILFFTGTLIMLAWAAINEPARMTEFTERFNGRSIETGAILFENNCATCHGQEGYGIAGRAPALNNPFLLNYSFFGEYDRQITALTDQIAAVDSEKEPEKKAELESQLAVVEAQRQELYETLRYDYSEQWTALDAQLTALDSRIQEELDIPASLLAVQVQQRNDEISALDAQLLPVTERITAAQGAGQTPDPADVQQQTDLQAQIDAKKAELSPFSTLNDERVPLQAKVVRYATLKDAHAQVQALRLQIADLESQLAALPEEDAGRADIETQLDNLQTQLSTQEKARDDALKAMVEAKDIIDFDPEADSRMTQLKWNGTLEDLIYTTLISGRPVSAAYWPSPMVAWAQDAGGPLRRDQVQNLTDYVLNWSRDFTLQDVRRINQLAVIPSASAGPTVEGVCPKADTDNASCKIDDVVTQISAITNADSTAGQQAYSQNGCAGCHYSGSAIAPAPQGVFTRAEQHAQEKPDLYPDARHYLVQSILLPNSDSAYGFTAGAMPQTFGKTLDLQTLGNIIAYLESQDQ